MRAGAGSLLWWVLAALAAPSAHGVEAVEDALQRQWYYTEVIVFQRPGVADFTSVEDLVHQEGMWFPRDLRRFRDQADPYGHPYPLSPLTRAHLTFPYLDLDALETPQLPAGDDAADPAGAADAPLEPVGVPPPVIRPDLAPDPLLDFLAAVAAFEADLARQSYRWLDSEGFALARQGGRLARRAGYQVLLHGRWLQPVPPREAPEPMLVRTGPRYGDVAALEGTLAVTLGRYLHFHADLAYREPLLGRAPVDRPVPPDGEVGADADATTTALPEALDPTGFMHMAESRRLRSEALHYLDHPKLGVLVRIDPVTIPPALSAAFEALEESQE